MLPIAIVAGLFFVVWCLKSPAGNGSSGGIASLVPSKGDMPDPAANPVAMTGRTNTTLAPSGALPALPGTNKPSPITTPLRMSGDNRVALRDTAFTSTFRSNMTRQPTVSTTNPATLPSNLNRVTPSTQQTRQPMTTTDTYRSGIKL